MDGRGEGGGGGKVRGGGKEEKGKEGGKEPSGGGSPLSPAPCGGMAGMQERWEEEEVVGGWGGSAGSLMIYLDPGAPVPVSR